MFGEIIYDNFLFDIPKILDLCVLFGKGNGQLLHKMIGKVIVKVLAWLFLNIGICMIFLWVRLVPGSCTHKSQNFKNRCFFVTNWIQFRVNYLLKGMVRISNNNV